MEINVRKFLIFIVAPITSYKLEMDDVDAVSILIVHHIMHAKVFNTRIPH